MDEDLKIYLQQMESRLNKRTDDIHGQTEELGIWLHKRMDGFETRLEELELRLRAHTEELESRLRAHTEDVETRLLSEFWKWARTADARYRQSSGQVDGLDVRMGILEDRVTDLEGHRH